MADMVSADEAARHSRTLGAIYSEEKGFVCFPTKFKAPMVRGWQQRTEAYEGPLWNACNGCGIKTGHESDLLVIDVDAPDREWFDKFWEHFKLAPTTWVDTPGGGYHLYFKWDKRVKNGKFKGMDIDIRSDGGQIIAPRSYYFTKDPKKQSRNGLKYKMRKGHGFEIMREIDEEFVKMYNFGINRETFEFGQKRVRFQPPAEKEEEVNDGNMEAFLCLMRAYAKQNGNHYQVWLNGVWSICAVAEYEGWDALEIADEWSKSLAGYEGRDAVQKKCAEYMPSKGAFGIEYILKEVSDQAKQDFSNSFERSYIYHDYTKLLKSRLVDLDEVRKYLRTAIVRVDRMGQVLFYLKSSKGTWHPSGFPFKGDMALHFKYEAPNPDFNPQKKPGPGNQPTVIEQTSMRCQLTAQQLSVVPNYQDLQYLPFHGQDPTPRGTFNVFRGYRHKIFTNKQYETHRAGHDFQFVMNHWLETMCNNNKEFFEYLMNWLAWMIRYGHKKPRVAIVMHGKEGIGKGLMWCELIWKGIIGESYGHVITDMSRFTEKFNLTRLNKSLHIFNECTSVKSGKVSWDKMKAIVTDRDIVAEPKGKEAFNAIDCAGCVFTGNHKHLVNLSNDDRRYACIEMSHARKGQVKYFQKLADLVENPVIQRTFFTYLLKRDLSKFNMSIIPDTQSRKHMKENKNRNNIVHFLCKLVTGTLGNVGGYDDFFDHKYNEETLFEKGACWYAQAHIWAAYCAYLDAEGVPARFRGNKSGVLKALKNNGLEIGRKVDRSGRNDAASWKTTQKTCWKISKQAVKKVCQNWYNNDDWDFPAKLATVKVPASKMAPTRR